MLKHISFDRFKRSMSTASLITAFTLVVSLAVPKNAMAQVVELDVPNDNIQPQVCVAENQVVNGSFESPEVPGSGNWAVFDGDGIAVNGWMAEWVNSQPFTPQIEIQESGVLSGVSAQDGDQYVEMDSDFGSNPFEGDETASIVLKQQVSTVVGAKYNVSFWTHPRPGYDEDDNDISFEFGTASDSIQANGADEEADDWELHSYSVVATSTNTELVFTDEGDANTFGMLLDNVSVTPICGNITGMKFNDENGNGVFDAEDEAGLEDWRIYLDLDGDNMWDEGTEPSEVTDEDGNFVFEGLFAMDDPYTVREVNQEGWGQTAPGVESDEEFKVNVGVQTPIPVLFGNQYGVTITAHKIVCNDESYLPNWGGGASNIDENTASDFVADSDGHCWMQEGWNFQWGPQDSFDPGDTLYGEAGAPWNTFGPTDANGVATAFIPAGQVEGNAHLWFREVLQEGYIPFTHDQNGNTNANDVSAEVYCHSDVLNYDNYDRIDGVKVGSGYDCVAFNYQVPMEDPDDDNACNFEEGTQGWYGEYYNYSKTHPDMNLNPALWPDNNHGDPLSVVSPWDTDWFTTDAYYRFAKIDSNLMFGGDWFPFDPTAEEIDNGHDYHFGNHWISKVNIPTDGNYSWTLTSDDDAWVYIDGNLETANPGIHPPTTINDSAFLTAGEHIVDVYFAERHTVQSHMYFSFNDENLTVRPWNDDCVDDEGNDDQGGYITGYKWNDTDGDGVWDEGEDGLSGVTIFVDLDKDGELDEGEPYCVTGSSNGIEDEGECTPNQQGRYQFTFDTDGTYVIREISQPGWVQTYPQTEAGYYEVTVSGGESKGDNYNFGNHEQDTCERSITGYVFHDTDTDTFFTGVDNALETWTVYLDLNNNNEWDSADEPSDETDASGFFAISGVLAPGSYTVREVTQSGWSLIYPTEGDEGEYLVTLDCFAKEVEVESDVLTQMLDVFVQAVESDGFENLRFANVISDDSSEDNGGGGSRSGSRGNNGSGDGSSGDNGEVLGEQVAADTLPVTGLGGIYLVLMIVMGLGLSFLLPKKELE